VPKAVEELKVVEAVLKAMELVVELGVSLRRGCLDIVLKVAARSGAQQGLEVASRSGGGGEVWRRQQALEAVEVVVEVVPKVLCSDRASSSFGQSARLRVASLWLNRAACKRQESDEDVRTKLESDSDKRPCSQLLNFPIWFHTD